MAAINGLAGIRAGFRGLEDAASTIVQETAPAEAVEPVEPPRATRDSGGNEERLTEALVDLKRYQHQVEASAVVVERTDQALGTLLDLRV